MPQTFLITGATGQQGGHTARLLLAAGHMVHVLARNPSSPTALELKSLGAVVFQGDFSDQESIVPAAQGCKGVFVNVSPIFTDPEGEQKNARNIIAACHKVGVKKIVQSSVSPPGEDLLESLEQGGWLASYYASKKACEDAVTSAEDFDSWTILRPGRLLSTYVAPLAGFMFPDLATKGVIRTALDKELKQPVLDPMDVGRLAVEALLDDTGTFDRVTISLATQEMTMDEIITAMNKALGKPTVKIEYLTAQEIEETKDKNPIVASEVFLNKKRLQVNLSKMSGFGIKTNTADEFFAREKEALAKAVGG